MSEQELNALIGLLNRTPLSPAEALWLQELIKRLREQAALTASVKGQ